MLCRWEAHQKHVFQRVDPAESKLMVRLYDDRGSGSFTRRRQIIGEGLMDCANIKVRVTAVTPPIHCNPVAQPAIETGPQ